MSASEFIEPAMMLLTAHVVMGGEVNEPMSLFERANLEWESLLISEAAKLREDGVTVREGTVTSLIRAGQSMTNEARFDHALGGWDASS
jgi:hypothetical protein